MEDNPQLNVDAEIVSQAMSDWFRYSEIDPDDKALAVLSRFAGELFIGGCRSADDLSTCLIAT